MVDPNHTFRLVPSGWLNLVRDYLKPQRNRPADCTRPGPLANAMQELLCEHGGLAYELPEVCVRRGRLQIDTTMLTAQAGPVLISQELWERLLGFYAAGVPFPIPLNLAFKLIKYHVLRVALLPCCHRNCGRLLVLCPVSVHQPYVLMMPPWSPPCVHTLTPSDCNVPPHALSTALCPSLPCTVEGGTPLLDVTAHVQVTPDSNPISSPAAASAPVPSSDQEALAGDPSQPRGPAAGLHTSPPCHGTGLGQEHGTENEHSTEQSHERSASKRQAVEGEVWGRASGGKVARVDEAKQMHHRRELQ